MTTSSRLAAGLLVVAGVGHALAIPHHADPGHGGPLQAAGFAAVAAAQLVGAAALAARPRPTPGRVLILVATAVLLLLWGVSRTVGLPYGAHPDKAEEVGSLDAITVIAQLGVVGLLARTRARHRVRLAFAASLAVAVVGIATFGIAADRTPAELSSHDHEPSNSGDRHPDDDVDRARTRPVEPAAAVAVLKQDHSDGDAGDPHAHR